MSTEKTTTPSLRPRPSKGKTKRPVVTRLKPERVQLVLRDLTGWKADPLAASMSRRFTFSSPRPAATFTQLVAELANDRNQAPEIRLHGRQVVVTLSTAHLQGLTMNDVQLARAISLVA